MKKIMFNDHYGLTQAVLDGRKTQTRRIAYISQHEADVLTGKIPTCPKQHIADCMHKARYKVGEVVAVAQSYDSIYNEQGLESGLKNHKGWRNKLFVAADKMPHRIRITDVRVERLQAISDEDCIAEGIYKDDGKTYFNGYAFQIVRIKYGNMLAKQWYSTPREAYAALIDKILGKGTFQSNPYVFVYEFELVK